MRHAASAIFLAAFLGVGTAAYRSTRPLTYPPGVLVPGDPAQENLSGPGEPIEVNGWTLRPLARFALDARVLHVRDYRRGPFGEHRMDAMADLVPRDLAVGWGRMSDQAVVDRFRLTQTGRFFFYEWWGTPPLPKPEIVSHAANLHVIASTEAIARAVANVRVGELVALRGQLVEVSRPGGPSWRSSLTRTDDGPGACETVWVEEFGPMAPAVESGSAGR